MKKWRPAKKPKIILKTTDPQKIKHSLEEIAHIYYDHLCRFIPAPKDVDLSNKKRGSK